MFVGFTIRRPQSGRKMIWAMNLVICMSILMASPEVNARPSVDLEKTVPLHLDSETLVPTHSIRPLFNNSISPWTSTPTFDKDRIPRFISEAQCSLQGCLNSHGTEDLHLESRPIQYQTLYLRRVKSPDSKSYHYRLESKLITVGCTCVKPIIQLQQ